MGSVRAAFLDASGQAPESRPGSLEHVQTGMGVSQ